MLRLESLDLVPPGGADAPRCPLCRSEGDASLPKVAQVRKAVDGLQRNIVA